MKLFSKLFAVIAALFSFQAVADEPKVSAQIAHKFSFQSLIDDQNMPLSDYNGKVLLIVNTASKCGFTNQYEGLEALYQRYKDQGLVVIGVPSDDFGGQELDSSEEIAQFCKFNYGVSFPMTKKESVSGESAHPFYRWADDSLGFGSAPKWNFHKYLVNQQGELVDYFNSTTKPQSSKIIEAIEAALAEK